MNINFIEEFKIKLNNLYDKKSNVSVSDQIKLYHSFNMDVGCFDNIIDEDQFICTLLYHIASLKKRN